MGFNPEMMNTILDVASEQGFELGLHALKRAFRSATSFTADVVLAQRIVDAGVNPIYWQDREEAMNMPFATPLLHAVANGHEDMVRFLLDKNARVDQRAPCPSPNFRGQPTALEVAVSWGRRAPALGAREAVSWIERSPGVVKLLLERQADPGVLKAYHLRDICEAFGMRKAGRKAELLARVSQWQREHA